jgi:RNA-directed DNA polymerase
MAADLGLTSIFITSFARGASHAYRSYPIRKRNGDTRTINHPSKQLKSMQRWLLSYVLEKLPIHAAATAYRKHRSIFDNARTHASNKFLLRMDCRQFFPSITEADLMLYIQERPSFFSSWSPLDIEVFCKLICRNSRLTIGAPTSPAISNALCYDMDSALSELCAKRSVTYTRYADDLFFSTSQPDILRFLQTDVEKLIPGLRLPGSLSINTEKTRHASKRGARRVTGIVLGSDGHPYIGRSLKRRIRAMIHKIDTLDFPTRKTLAGLVSYAVGFDPDFMNSLVTKYGHAVMRKARFPKA